MSSRSRQVSEAGTSHVNSDLESDPRWGLVQRIILSPHFIKSARLQDFLRYVCQRSISNEPDEINEQRIGERVFERTPDYNPNEDNIVRSQARLLRRKLEEYFASDGADEPLILTIPKGGYAPEFIERASLAEPPAGGRESGASPWRTPLVRWLTIAVTGLALVTILLTWLLIRRAPAPETPAPAETSAIRALWSQLFTPGQPTTIIIPDHTFAMVQEVSGQHVDLATYLRRSFRSENADLRNLEEILPGFSIRRYTTFDAVTSAVRVSQLAEQFSGRVIVRYARDMTLRDLSPGNVVLIGRPLSNAWNEMFDSKLNFNFYSDLERRVIICQNRAPQPGEQAEYLPVDDGAKRTVYASVAFLRNVNNAGNVLIISGNSSGSQEIAAELITNEALLKGFVDKIPHLGRGLPYFELLVRTTTLAGVAQESEVVAWRIQHP